MALVRRYPCLYTNEAHKKPQNQRKLDGFLSVHHHNCSAVLWDEDCRTQLKWSFLRGHPGRATHSNGSGGVTPKFKLQEDEEVAFGESHKAWITGPAVEETIQDLQGAAREKERKRAAVAAWRREEEDEPESSSRQRKRARSSLSSGLSSPFAVTGDTTLRHRDGATSTPTTDRVSASANARRSVPLATRSGTATNAQGNCRSGSEPRAAPLWRKSENAQIGVSPVVKPVKKEEEEEGSLEDQFEASKPASSSTTARPTRVPQTFSSTTSTPSATRKFLKKEDQTPKSLKGVSPKLLKPFRPPSRRSNPQA